MADVDVVTGWRFGQNLHWSFGWMNFPSGREYFLSAGPLAFWWRSWCEWGIHLEVRRRIDER